jgi:hypothetical protein
MGVKYLTANPVFHGRIKHVEIDYHFIRERASQKLLEMAYISSGDQVADGFTKALSVRLQEIFKCNLNLKKVMIEGGC